MPTDDVDTETLDAYFGPRRTTVPALVVSFSPGGPGQVPTVSARVIVRTPFAQEDGTLVYYESPVVHGIPVVYPGNGAGVGITWKLSPGDEVTLLVADRSHDEYRAGDPVDGGVIPADIERRNDLSDAVALPGTARPGTDTSARIPVNGDLHVFGEAVRVGGAAATLPAALASAIESYLSARWASYILHVHSGVTTGAGVSGPPSDAADPGGPVAPGDFSSNKLFVDS